MEVLNKYTGKLRQAYFDNLRATIIKLGIALLITIIVTCLFDYFVPFESWYNFIRAFVVAAGGFVLFSVGYLVTFFFSQANRVKDVNYVPVKDRFSPTWRRRIGIIIGALIFAVIFSTDKEIPYSLINSGVLAIITGLVIFLSMTEEEIDREYYGVPDVRDNVYIDNMKKTRERKALKKSKNKSKDD